MFVCFCISPSSLILGFQNMATLQMQWFAMHLTYMSWPKCMQTSCFRDGLNSLSFSQCISHSSNAHWNVYVSLFLCMILRLKSVTRLVSVAGRSNMQGLQLLSQLQHLIIHELLCALCDDSTWFCRMIGKNSNGKWVNDFWLQRQSFILILAVLLCQTIYTSSKPGVSNSFSLTDTSAL